MILGSYIDGRLLGYDEATHRFDIGGTPLPAHDLARIDACGQIRWGSPAQHDWFYRVGADAFARAAGPVSAVGGARSAGTAMAWGPRSNSAQAPLPRSEALRTHRITMALLVVIATIAVIGAIALGVSFAHIVHDDYAQATHSAPLSDDGGYRT